MKCIITLALFVCTLAAVNAAETGHNHDTLNPKKIELFTPYPLTRCIVSDEVLGGDMGDALSFVHDGQEYTICCKSCTKKFAKNPARYVKKLADVQAQGKATHTEPKKKDAHGGHGHGGHQH